MAEKAWDIAGAKVGKMSESLEVENRSIGKTPTFINPGGLGHDELEETLDGCS